MKKIILNILVGVLKLIYLPMKLKKTRNKIVYISRQSNTEPLDFKLVREQMEKLNPEIENVIITKKIEKGFFNKIKYCGNILKQMNNIATSKVVILDTYCIPACVLNHKKDTKIIQIWHALGAIKKFGYQSINTKSGSDETTAKIMCMHKNYDYILAPSEETAKIYKDAFNTSEKHIKYLGMPRIDYILKEDEDCKAKIYRRYPELKNKTNILYVPTFRKDKKIEIDEFISKINTDKYNLIIKLHPLDLKKYKKEIKDGIIYENDFKTYDLLKVSDKIVTDYSSLAMEASLLDKPVYFYTYDIDEYEITPGLNFNFKNEEIGKYQTQEANQMLKLIDENYDLNILNIFKEKYISVDTNNCSQGLANFIIRLVNNEEIEDMGIKPSKEKSNI